MDSHLLDRRMRQDRGLHFEAGDVLATPSQVVLLAIDEIEEAVLVEPADVAGVEPEIAPDFQRVLRSTPVTLEDDVRQQRPTNDFARRANGNLIVVVIKDADIELWSGLA